MFGYQATFYEFLNRSDLGNETLLHGQKVFQRHKLSGTGIHTPWQNGFLSSIVVCLVRLFEEEVADSIVGTRGDKVNKENNSFTTVCAVWMRLL